MHKHVKAIYLALFLALLLSIIGGVALRDWLDENRRQVLELRDQIGEIQQQINVTSENIEDIERQIAESDEEELKIESRKKKEREILAAQKVFRDVLVDGVEIITSGERKIINNIVEAYNIEVPNNLLIARSVSSNWIELHDPAFMCEGDPDCEPIIRIATLDENPDKLSLEEWFLSEEQKAGGPIYFPREEIVIQGQAGQRISEEIPTRFEGFYYYFARDTKIYYVRISSFDISKYIAYIETFSFGSYDELNNKDGVIEAGELEVQF